MSRKKGRRARGQTGRVRAGRSPRAQRLDLLTRYELALAAGEGGGFLRRDPQRQASLRREPVCTPQDGVLHRHRQPLAARGHHLRDEERVATRLATKRLGVDARLRREPRDG
jgi:hypothetical protein